MNEKPFLYFDKLTQWNVGVIVFYIIFTIVVVFINTSGRADVAQMVLIAYVVITQLMGYFFMYKALRNFTVYLICCGFALLHIFLYFLFKGNLGLKTVQGDFSSALFNSIILIILFQVLRYLSLKIQKREFVVPAKGGGKDLFDNIEPSIVDKILFVIYFVSFGGLTYLALALSWNKL